MGAMDSDSAKKPPRLSRHAEKFSMNDDADPYSFRMKRLSYLLAAEFGISAKILPQSIARR